MGFYSFIKWVRSFSKRHYDDMIRWYNESLLTYEEKAKRRYEYRTMLAKLMSISSILGYHIDSEYMKGCINNEIRNT